MRVFITSDIHGKQDFEKIQPRLFPMANSLLPDDILLIAGDFGLPIFPDRNTEDYYLDDLNSRGHDVLFIDGNHEHFSFLGSLPVEHRFGSPVGVLRPNIFHLRRGHVYRIGGNSFFIMGGARGIGNMIGYGYDSKEIPSDGEWSRAFDFLEENEWSVDFVVTHAAPERFLEHVYGDGFMKCPVSKKLDEIYDNLSFKKWFCGHYHKDIDFNSEGVHFINERVLEMDFSQRIEKGTRLENHYSKFDIAEEAQFPPR